MNYAHPRGWIKGKPVNLTTVQGKPAVAYTLKPEADLPCTGWLQFSNEAARDEWLKWWSKR